MVIVDIARCQRCAPSANANGLGDTTYTLGLCPKVYTIFIS